MERFTQLGREQMTPRQAEVADEIVAGPRGGLRGPFNAWLRSPELAAKFQKVGEFVRFNSSLPDALNELAILVTARYWTSQYEWYAHRELAMKAGLAPAIADAIAKGEKPTAMSSDETIVFTFAHELHHAKAVTDATFAAMKDRFGEAGVIDIIAACGYYTAVSMTLNVAGVPIPADAVPLAPLPK